MIVLESLFRKCFVIFAFLIVAIKCAYLFNILPFMIAGIGTVGILALCLFAFGYWQKMIDTLALHFSSIDRLSYKEMMIILALVSLITKLIAVAILRVESLNDGSDIDVYVTAAYELGTTGKAITHAGYLMSFSHMYWYGIFLSPVAALFGISQTAFSIYLTLVLTISTLLLFSTYSEQVGKNKAFIIFMIFTVLPGTVLLPQYITHEIALLFFESIAVWLYFKCIPRCHSVLLKSLLFIVFLVSLLAAVMMNTAGLVMCIAFGILFFVQLLKRIDMKAAGLFAVKILLLVVVLLGGNKAAVSFQQKHSEVPDNYILSNKVLWTMYVGANVENKGQWNLEDSKKYGAYDHSLSYEEIQDYRKKLVYDRYKELIHNPKDLVYLIKQKLITVWGVFEYSILYTNENIPNQRLQALYNSYLDRPLLLIEYGASVFASIICLVEVIRHRKEESEFVLLLQLLLMGITAMLMLTECRNKYTISIQPFFWMTCFASSRRTQLKVTENEK